MKPCHRWSVVVAFTLLISACRPPPPEPEVPMPTTTPAEPAAPSRDIASRIIFGTPNHRYPLREEVPLATKSTRPNITAQVDKNGSVRLTLPLSEHEAIWGFGQRFDAFNLRGTKLESWTTDGWNASDTSYHAVPFFISSEGYGLFINHPGKILFDIGHSQPNMMTITVPDHGVEVIVLPGEPAEISQRYTELVGRPRAVPDWIYQPWISRNSYLGAYEIDRVTDKMRALGMPVGVAVLEAWEEQLHNFKFTTHRYPDPAGWIKKLNAKGVHVVCWITSSVLTYSDAYREAKERGYLVLNDDGSEHVVRWLENGRKIDFRKPEARAWWRDLHKPLIEIGVEGFKTDGGEHMPDPDFHNQHAYYYQEASLDAFRDLGKTGITFARSANPLNAGLSTYWAGDQKAEWRGLKMVLRGALSTSLSGFPFWGHDIGAYSESPSKELYIRWLQVGALSPIMQFHGIDAREPWHFDEQTLDIARFYFQLRERLIPFLITWGEATRRDGTPIIRPMVWAYPNDTKGHTIDDQYFFGPDLLVAPITDPMDVRGVYLPEGNWIDVWTGESKIGPTQFLHTAPLHRIPVFARAEAYETYRTVFAGEPVPKVVPQSVTLAGPKNSHGLVPSLRYWKEGNEPEIVHYEVENHTATNQRLRVRLTVPSACVVEPSDQLNLLLGPGERQRLAYHVSARDTSPASHVIRLELHDEHGPIATPEVTLVVPPRWKVIGLFDGGVGSHQPLDGQAVRLDATHTGKHGKTVSWQEVPGHLIEANGRINLESLTGADGSSTTYLATTLSSDQTREVRFAAGFGDAMTVWLNGRLLHEVIGHRNAERDEDRFTGTLVPGVNHILIRNSRDLASPHFYFRVIR
jgi:alpha-D-xyloside xylohydrolase